MTTRERPRAVVQRVDLSAIHVAPVAARNSEDVLLHGYRAMPEKPELEQRSCVCGGVVTADPLTPAKGVQAHNYSPRHKAWRNNHETWLYAA